MHIISSGARGACDAGNPSYLTSPRWSWEESSVLIWGLFDKTKLSFLVPRRPHLGTLLPENILLRAFCLTLVQKLCPAENICDDRPACSPLSSIHSDPSPLPHCSPFPTVLRVGKDMLAKYLPSHVHWLNTWNFLNFDLIKVNLKVFFPTLLMSTSSRLPSWSSQVILPYILLLLDLW